MATDDLKKGVENLFTKMETSEQAMVDHMKANFDPEDIAQMTTILSMYQPLISACQLILQHQILLNKAGQIKLLPESITQMEAWLLQYKSLNERVKIFNSGATMQ